MANITLNDIYLYAGKENYMFARNRDRWTFLLESYEGGEVYRRGEHLTRYVLETAGEYRARLAATPLDNHCRSVINVYISFLFREPIERNFGSQTGSPEIEEFLRDADLDGRSLDAFMKEVAIWSSVFGHAWILMSKPTVEATTLADQLAQGVRPYVNVLTPLVVTDWAWERTASGRYELSYFKYVEDVNDTVITIKEWTNDTIRTYIVDEEKKEGHMTEEVINGLGRIPAVLVYNQRSQVRGMGLSDISDIADQQRAIYNELSEVEQSIRLEGHPSLVMTPDVQAGSGAGAIVLMPENLDPGLKPYMLDVDPVPIDAIYTSIKNRVESIDRMANTGSVRATETRDISGIAMKTEFQLLNAKLSEKADNLELAEEQMWRLWSEYQAREWDGSIHYPDAFDLTDTAAGFNQLKTARDSATDPRVLAEIDQQILTLMGVDQLIDQLAPVPRTYESGELIDARLPPAYRDATGESRQCQNCAAYSPETQACSTFGGALVRPQWVCAQWQPLDS
jgi:hypothetical protein